MAYKQLSAALAANFIELKACPAGPNRNILLAENQRLSGLLRAADRQVGQFTGPNFGGYSSPKC